MKYIIYFLLVCSIQGQSIKQNLYADQNRTVLISTHVDSYSKINDFIFYRKGNKLYSYSLNSNSNYFIDWNVDHFSIGPDETLAYQKGYSFYLKAPPYKASSKHITWNVSNYFWTIDGTLIFQKFHNSYILNNKFEYAPKLITSNIEKWVISPEGEIAFLKQNNLYFIDNKNTGSKKMVQANIDDAFFVNGSLYFIKNDSLWVYSRDKNYKERLLYQVKKYYACGDELYVYNNRGLYVVSEGNIFFTGHYNISKIQTSFRGISYISNNRLYFLSSGNVIDVGAAPQWSTFSCNGCLYLYTNNSLCFLDEYNKVIPVLEGVYSPRYSNRRIYFTQNNRRQYLDPASGKILPCK